MHVQPEEILFLLLSVVGIMPTDTIAFLNECYTNNAISISGNRQTGTTTKTVTRIRMF